MSHTTDGSSKRKKRPLLSFDATRDEYIAKGVQYTEEARAMIAKIEERLDEQTLSDFRAELEHVMYLAKALNKKTGPGLMPKFIYTNFINPRQFMNKAQDLHKGAQDVGGAPVGENAQYSKLVLLSIDLAYLTNKSSAPGPTALPAAQADSPHVEQDLEEVVNPPYQDVGDDDPTDDTRSILSDASSIILPMPTIPDAGRPLQHPAVATLSKVAALLERGLAQHPSMEVLQAAHHAVTSAQGEMARDNLDRASVYSYGDVSSISDQTIYEYEISDGDAVVGLAGVRDRSTNPETASIKSFSTVSLDIPGAYEQS